MTSEKEEFFYHECMTHPALLTHPNPQSVLVIGGGDGGSSEEIFKHPGVKRIVMAELDAAVIDVARTYLGEIHRGALNDPRLEIRIGDGFEYVRNATEKFDLIVLDLTDPDTPAFHLYMPWGLFYELSDIWPCAYNTSRCEVLDTGAINPVPYYDAAAGIRMRDEMRGNMDTMTGQFLLIDGERVEVVVDEAIVETPLAGSSFRSSVYFVPMTVLGGTPATWFETKNYDAPNGALEFANAMAPGDSYFTSDGGRFLWHKKPPTNFCVQMVVKTEPRVLLMTPHIAARMTNVKWTPLAHERDWEVDGSFYVDGGGTSRDIYGPSYYSPN